MKIKLITHEQVGILDWLSKLDYGSVQSDLLALRVPGSGKWLLQSDQFQEWLATKARTLFCPGIPGAGKTIMSAITIEALEAMVYDQPSIGLAYVYCNFQRQDEQTATSLLGSLLKQLSARQPSLPECITDLHKFHSTRRTRPSLEEILECLDAVVHIYGKVFIVIDALDECQSAGGCRAKLLAELFSVQNRHGVNIFATSRFIPEIVDKFHNSIQLEISAKSTDIAEYLHARIPLLPLIVRKNPSLQQEIFRDISQAINGM